MSRAMTNAGIVGKFGLIDFLKLRVNIATAAGSNSQANSTVLVAAYNLITTLSAVTTRGVKAFAAVTGDLLIVKNNQTTNLKLYPATSSAMGTAAVNAAASVGALKTAIYIARNRIKWDLLLTIA